MNWQSNSLILGVWKQLSIAKMLAGRELLSEYRQSRMSLVWPVLYPVLYTLLFVMLRPILGGGMPEHSLLAFATFVFIGFTMWQTWFEVLRGQMDAIRRNKSLMSRGELSSSTLFGATTLVAIAHFLPRLIVSMIAAALVMKASIGALMLLLVFGFAVLLNGAAIGALMQPFATLSADLGKTIQSISLGILVTGAVFLPLPEQASPLINTLISINPMGSLLNAARATAMGDAMVNPTASVAWMIVTIGLILLLPFVGRRVLPIVIERMGN